MVVIKDLLRKFNNTSVSCAENKHSFKSAFSLAEVLVSMLIMSLFFLATTKVISIKQKDEMQSYPHGYYECIGSGSSYQVHRSEGGAQTIPSSTAKSCEFMPAKNIPVYNVYITLKDGSIYKQSEPQLSTEDDTALTFKGAAGLLKMYEDIYNEGDVNINAQMMSNYDNGELTQFKDYISVNYPDSLISKNWTDDKPTKDAVFIVW